MSSREQHLEASVVRLSRELDAERRAHALTKAALRRERDRAEAAERRENRWRWVAQIIHRAQRPDQEDT